MYLTIFLYNFGKFSVVSTPCCTLFYLFKGISADEAEFRAAASQRIHSTFFFLLLSLFWSENVPQTPDLFWCPLSPRPWRKAEISSLGLSYLVPNIKTNLRRLNFCALKRLWTETAANPWGSCLLELLPLLIHPFFNWPNTNLHNKLFVFLLF